MIEQEEIDKLLTEIKDSTKVLNAIGDEMRQHIIFKMLSSNHSNEERCSGRWGGEGAV